MQHMREVALQVGDTNLWDELLTYAEKTLMRLLPMNNAWWFAVVCM